MSDAPERIWAYAGSFKMWRDHKTDRPHTQTEYVRADMLQEIFVRYSKAESDRIEELEAKLAKALVSVADLYRLHLRRGPAWDHTPTKQVMEDANTLLTELYADLKGQDYE